MTPEALAALHRKAFEGPPRPWTAEEFSTLLETPGVHLYTLPTSFLVARYAGPEAEVLTLCTDPAHRRQGHARTVLHLFEAQAHAAGIEEVFLEVAETNLPARALYAAYGYRPRGYRKDYYQGPGQTRVQAHVLAKQLSESHD